MTVQRNRMKFGVIVAINSDCVSLSLRLCSLFTFGVESLLLHRFDAPFKCTVDKCSQLPTRMCYAAETSAIQFLFSSTLKWFTFLGTLFWTAKKKNPGL